MGAEIGILWVLLGFLVVGVFWLFFAAGETLTPKKSLLTGQPRTPEEVSKKGFTKGVVLFILAIWILGMVFSNLN
jgi:hypothetical protein